MMDRDQLKIKEIIDNGDLAPFEETLKSIYHKIKEANCRIAVRYDREESSHEMKIGVNGGCRIWLSLKEKRENPVRVIWDILHEYGHHLSGDSIDKIKIERERIAWDFAEKEIQNFPDLLESIDDFFEYRDHCLRTYM